MNAKSLDPVERYGEVAIKAIREYLADSAADSASEALDKALPILIQTKEKQAKIAITLVIKEWVTPHRERAVRVDVDTDISGKLKASLKGAYEDFIVGAEQLPGMEGV